MKKKLEIFDLDGTLIDTSLTNYYSYLEAALKYGVKLKFDYKEFVEKYNGKSYTDFLNFIDNEKRELIHQEKKNIYLKYLSKCKLNDKLFKHIEDVKNENYIVLATSASKQNTYEVLNYFDKLSLFDLILTRDDVEKIKPDPEVFFKAIDYFKIKTENTIVYEDSSVGIIAAENANIKVFKIDKF